METASAAQDILRVSGWNGASLVFALACATAQGMKFLLLGEPYTRFPQDQGCRGPEIAWQCLSSRGEGAEGHVEQFSAA